MWEYGNMEMRKWWDGGMGKWGSFVPTLRLNNDKVATRWAQGWHRGDWLMVVGLWLLVAGGGFLTTERARSRRYTKAPLLGYRLATRYARGIRSLGKSRKRDCDQRTAALYRASSMRVNSPFATRWVLPSDRTRKTAFAASRNFTKMQQRAERKTTGKESARCEVRGAQHR